MCALMGYFYLMFDLTVGYTCALRSQFDISMCMHAGRDQFNYIYSEGSVCAYCFKVCALGLMILILL